MEGFEIGCRTGEEILRFIGALGRHRYVASRLHLVHAFAIDAAGLGDEAGAWAKRVIDSQGVIDLGSRDERLYRRATDAELVGTLTAFWTSDGRDAARARLTAHLASIGVEPATDGAPFDEAAEEEIFPILVDGGWELLPIASLDPARHAGAIGAFGDDLGFDVARFEEENAVPPIVTLHELPTFGPTELLAAFDADGRSREPFVLWQAGNDTYLDYVMRGVLRASKLELDDAD